MGTNQKIIDALCLDMAKEHGAIYQYMIHAAQLRDTLLAEKIMDMAREEMWHFDWLVDAIKDRGGQPTLDRAAVFMSAALGDSVRADVAAEEDALDHYERTLDVIGDTDPALTRLIERIMDDERHHKAAFVRMAEAIARDGEGAYASTPLIQPPEAGLLGSVLAVEYGDVYLPSSLALRREGDVLPSIADENIATFRYGMKCFFEEGRALAKLSHPNVVRVLNFFRANETVYLVMRYERGRTLQEHIQARRGAMKENFIRRVFTLLLNGLREVHANKLLHLDIKPANIYIRNDITPVLIDFGAARQTLTAEGFKLNPMYTPGFASPEHYQKREILGPWSDIYSIGASIFACLAGAAPQAADLRVEKDRYVSATKIFADKYSDQLLETIDWCLQLDHSKRPQSVMALQKVLLREKDPEGPSRRSFVTNLRGALGRLARR